MRRRRDRCSAPAPLFQVLAINAAEREQHVAALVDELHRGLRRMIRNVLVSLHDEPIAEVGLDGFRIVPERRWEPLRLDAAQDTEAIRGRVAAWLADHARSVATLDEAAVRGWVAALEP